VSIAIELESERGPGWHTQIAEAILLVDKIEIVMEAAPRVIFEKSFVRFLVVPRFEGSTCLHGGKNMDESRVIATFRDDFFNPLFLPEVFFEDELDFDSIVTGDGPGAFINHISHRRRPMLKVKNPDIGSIEETRDSSRITNIRQSSLDDYSVKTRDLAEDII